MKTFFKPQAFFICLTLIWSTLIFNRLFLYLENSDYRSVPMISSLYAILMFVSGLICGYFDSIRLLRIDIGFRYHLITFVSVHVAYAAMLVIQNPVIAKVWLGLLVQFLVWGLGLLIHYLRSRSSIKGYQPEDLF